MDKPKPFWEEFDTRANSLGYLALFYYIVFIVLPWIPARNKTFNVYWYSVTKGTDSERVFFQAEPLDCDFLYAPIGNKGCHYDKVVTVIPKDEQHGEKSVDISWDKIKE